MCPDAWANWGRYCDNRYSANKQQPTWLEFAASCYAQGIRLLGTEARSLVPRLLHLLMLDVNGSEFVGRPLVQQAGDMPSWVWLPWLPQLITSLQRPETAVARRILNSAAQHHPQYVYWQIRPAISLLKDQALRAVNAAKDRAKTTGMEKDEAGARGQGAPSGKEGEAKAGGDTEMSDVKDPAVKEEHTGSAAASEGPQGTIPEPATRLEKPMEVSRGLVRFVYPLFWVLHRLLYRCIFLI